MVVSLLAATQERLHPLGEVASPCTCSEAKQCALPDRSLREPSMSMNRALNAALVGGATALGCTLPLTCALATRCCSWGYTARRHVVAAREIAVEHQTRRHENLFACPRCLRCLGLEQPSGRHAGGGNLTQPTCGGGRVTCAAQVASLGRCRSHGLNYAPNAAHGFMS